MNRTRDGFGDQTRRSGHHDRPADLDLFANLGFEAIRYPILWERVAPDDPALLDWSWSDERLGGLRIRGIRPIAGLVHHGSGPCYTDLLDDGFAAGLGHYAGKVAERYPWIEDWTPVNEPLTTARFSALYGHWYPHERDENLFWRALLNQIDGTRAAMHAIRRVNSAARLIQTDDLGRTYSTSPLTEQAAADNVRRWAGWDLLFGRVTRHHPLWERLDRAGLGERLRAIADDPCPPDVIGVNHYLTSDRFLDHRLQPYPAHTHGGNGRSAYADVEAVRVLDPAPHGLADALREAWDRYGVSLALTEVHNGCTREEQLRWVADAWDTAVALRADGVDICAVTAWALLGSHGWNTLLTAPGVYEPGVFDVVSGTPRPTALAALWRGLPHDAPRHPAAAGPGWWHRPERLSFTPSVHRASAPQTKLNETSPALLICGATGVLARGFINACVARGLSYQLSAINVSGRDEAAGIASALDRFRPWAVVNATGYERLDEAQRAEPDWHRIDSASAITLAQACAARGIGCVTFSSDLVLEGQGRGLCLETDPVQPLDGYGRSRAAMEAACAGLPGVLVARTAALFSPDDPQDFAAAVVRSLERRQRFAAAHDHVVTPTYVPALVDAALDLLIDGAEGIWHLAGDEAVSPAEFATRIAHACALDAGQIDAVAGTTLSGSAPASLFAALASARGAAAGTLEAGLASFARHRWDHRRETQAA